MKLLISGNDSWRKYVSSLPSQRQFLRKLTKERASDQQNNSKKINSFTDLTTLFGDKLFSRAAEDLDLSLKKARSQKDKLILHQKCGRRELNDKGQLGQFLGLNVYLNLRSNCGCSAY